MPGMGHRTVDGAEASGLRVLVEGAAGARRPTAHRDRPLDGPRAQGPPGPGMIEGWGGGERRGHADPHRTISRL